MKAYKETHFEHLDTPRPFDTLAGVPVAVELLPGSETLPLFNHPDDAIYVFGPEDGSLPRGIKTACHRFVTIPTFHCMNLAAACYVTLYDRSVKSTQPLPSIATEERGWECL